MEKKINTTVVIPVHIYNDEVRDLLKSSIDSVREQTLQPERLAIVAPKDIILDIARDHNVDIIVNNTGETDFCSQLNCAVTEITTDFFTILEFDDLMTVNSLKMLEKFKESKDFSKSDVILPLVSLIRDGKEIMFVNDAAWAQEFSEKQGFLDLKSLKENDSFIISGATINVEKFKSINGLKKEIKLFFTKEFLMRAVFNNLVISVLPKIGMLHTVNREGSLFNIYKAELKKEEIAYYDKVVKGGEYKYNNFNSKLYSPVTEG